MSKPRAGMTAVGHHQPEDARVEVDHLFEVEGIEANVAELGVGHRVHRRSPGTILKGLESAPDHITRRQPAGKRADPHAQIAEHLAPNAASGRRPDFGLDFLLLYDIAVRARFRRPRCGWRCRRRGQQAARHRIHRRRCLAQCRRRVVRRLALAAAVLAGCGSISERHRGRGFHCRPANTTSTPARISTSGIRTCALAADGAGAVDGAGPRRAPAANSSTPSPIAANMRRGAASSTNWPRPKPTSNAPSTASSRAGARCSDRSV